MRQIKTTVFFLLQPVLQLVLMLVLARYLSLEETGRYFILAAISIILVEFVSIGYGESVVRENARNKANLSHHLYGLLVRISQTLPVAVILATCFAVYSLGQDRMFVIFAFFIMDLTGQRLIASSEHFWIASDAHDLADFARIFSPLVRLIVVLIALGAFGSQSGLNVAMSGAAGVFIGGLGMLAMMGNRFGFPRRSKLLPLHRTMSFSLNQFARSSQVNIDRYALSLVADPGSVAIYTVATRVVLAACLPVQAVMRNSYKRYFKLGRRSLKSAVLLTRKNAAITISLGLAAAIGIFAGAPVLPILLGAQYGPAMKVAQFLCFIPLLWALYYLLANVMTGIDQLGRRSAISFFSVGLQAALILWLSGEQQQTGAAIAQYIGLFASILLTAASLAFDASITRRRNRDGSSCQATVD